ncbi:MAG: hypothetical protein KJP01_04130 [Gramella sp.]|nr:hypothetical protein [Christiangramia sp.]
MRNFLTALLIFGGISISSAQSINQYKYILIPETFEFTGKVNEYQLNSLIKYLFEQEGYNTLMRTEREPDDLDANPCLGLVTRVKNNSGLFVSKLIIELEDCKGRNVYQSKEGRSREKEYGVAYQEALKDAFSSFKEFDYEYMQETNANESGVDAIATGNNQLSKNSEKAQKVQKAVKTEKAQKIEKVEKFEKEEKDLRSKMDDQVKPVTKQLSSDSEYEYAGKIYFLNRTSEGYELFQEGSIEPIAILVATEEEKSYIYTSLTRQGVGYFDSGNNLVIEYFDRTKNEKVTLRYILKN